jgi:hypothetical protein
MLRHALTNHIVSTAYERGWAALKNGDLLKIAEAEFDAFVTTDKNLYRQQNLKNLKLAVLVLPFASWPKLQLHLEAIISVVNDLSPGDFIEFRLQKD